MQCHEHERPSQAFSAPWANSSMDDANFSQESSVQKGYHAVLQEHLFRLRGAVVLLASSLGGREKEKDKDNDKERSI